MKVKYEYSRYMVQASHIYSDVASALERAADDLGYGEAWPLAIYVDGVKVLESNGPMDDVFWNVLVPEYAPPQGWPEYGEDL